MKEEIIKTLKVLLKYQTVKENKKEFEELFCYIKQKLNKDLYIEEYKFNDNQSLVVSNTPEKELDIIFCVHVDVVPIDDYSYQEDEENIYGRGTVDMKGSVAVCIEMMNHLKTSKKVALFITSDEEQDGNCAYQLLKIYHSKLAIVPDGGTSFQLIKEEKGLLQLELSIKTKSAHSSQPFNGENAITKLIEIYQKLIEKYPLPANVNDYKTSINLSKIIGGKAFNQVPDEAKMSLDIRHIAKDKKEDFIKEIQSINKKVDIKVILEGNVFETDLNNKEIKRYINICEEILKKKIEIVGCESTSDAIYFCEKKIPTIIMNPIGYYAHCDNEYVNKDSLEKLYEIYIKFIEEGEENE